MRWWILPRFLAVTFAVLVWTTNAHADLDGRWKQSALREDFTVQNWLDAGCGPPPASTSSGGGEVVEVRTEGDELAFVGGGRVYRTNACYDAMPNLQRGSHSRDANGKTWRTRCTTAPNDPRSAVLNTLVNATTERHIDLVETGRYEITLQNGKCVADIKRTRSFDKVSDDGAPASAGPAPVPAPLPKTPDTPAKSGICTTPGDPTKLEVRPSRKLLRPGESFRLRGVVLDANGCETKTLTTWRLAADATGKGVKVDGLGNVTSVKDAPEGTVEIVATAAGRDARVTVEIVSAANYDSLLAKDGLNAAGENEEAATATIATQSIGTDDARVDDHSRSRRIAFLSIIGVALAGLIVAALVLVRRSRRAKELLAEAEERHDEKVRAASERRVQREAEYRAQLRAHEESVALARAVSSSNAVAAAMAPPSQPSVSQVAGPAPAPASSRANVSRSGGGGACPVCNTVYGSDTFVCPQHGVKLVAQRPLAPAAPVVLRGKICPTCGERFDGTNEFCGKDGTALVLLN